MTESSRPWAGAQSVGRRHRQEDAFAVLPLSGGDPASVLLIVCDGMGGHAGGQEAAQAAVAAFVEAFRDAPRGTAGEDLERALGRANAAVAALKSASPSLEDAGCTVVAALVRGLRVGWISVGDSSLSLLRDGVLQRLNADHSMKPVLAEMVASGRMNAETATSHPNRNALRSAVSGDDIELVDLSCDVALQPGDQILLASDGLDTLPARTLTNLLERLESRSPEEAVATLLDTVERKGAPRQDNTTVVLYRASGVADDRVGRVVSGSSSSLRRSARLALLAGLVVIVVGAIVWRLTSSWWSSAPHAHSSAASAAPPASAGQPHAHSSTASAALPASPGPRPGHR